MSQSGQTVLLNLVQINAAPFWSGGLGLNIHNYEFMQNQSAISLLRIRGSYGSLGKGGFPPFAAITTYETYSKDWYSTGYGAVLKYLGNPDLKWEKTNTLDVGFEVELYHGILFLKAAYYVKKQLTPSRMLPFLRILVLLLTKITWAKYVTGESKLTFVVAY